MSGPYIMRRTLGGWQFGNAEVASVGMDERVAKEVLAVANAAHAAGIAAERKRVVEWLRSKLADGPVIEQHPDMTVLRVGKLDNWATGLIRALANQLEAHHGD